MVYHLGHFMQIDIDLIKVVVEDLNYLNFEWDQEISDTSLRMSNVLLRKLPQIASAS